MTKTKEKDAQPERLTNSIGMEFRLIRAGRFLMGDELDPDNPPHPVTITRDSCFGVFPVANAQFRQFRPDHSSGEYKGHSLEGDDQPVVQVSWQDADEFCAWLSKKEGKRYRLPTEAEWEYCCRAGRSNADSRYPWGPAWPPVGKAGNYADETARRTGVLEWCIEGYDDGFPVTSPLGAFDPNPWGIGDMGGNVWEWCQDWYDETFCKKEAIDPAGPKTGTARVLRGASWLSDNRDNLRVASRLKAEPDVSDDLIGFRVAISLGARR